LFVEGEKGGSTREGEMEKENGKRGARKSERKYK